LWARGVQSDPGSSYNWSEYGRALLDARSADRSGLHEPERIARAKDALDQALKIRPVTTAMLNRAQIAIQENRLADAQADLTKVLQAFPDTVRAYKLLAMAYQNAHQLDDAAATIRTAREKIPGMRCGLTE